MIMKSAANKSESPPRECIIEGVAGERVSIIETPAYFDEKFAHR